MNPAQAPTDPTTLLVWDAPNIDMSLGSILGGRPSSASRPRFDVLGRWLLGLAGEDSAAEATVFTNVASTSTDFIRPWVEALRNTGFAVFAKPKIDDSDIDDDMLDHIRGTPRSSPRPALRCQAQCGGGQLAGLRDAAEAEHGPVVGYGRARGGSRRRPAPWEARRFSSWW